MVILSKSANIIFIQRPLQRILLVTLHLFANITTFKLPKRLINSLGIVVLHERMECTCGLWLRNSRGTTGRTEPMALKIL